MNKLRPRLTYSNVILTLCLFLLVGGGTAYAASHLPKNSVGTKQLKKSAVTPAKLSAASKAALVGPKRDPGQKGDRGLSSRRCRPGKRSLGLTRLQAHLR